MLSLADIGRSISNLGTRLAAHPPSVAKDSAATIAGDAASDNSAANIADSAAATSAKRSTNAAAKEVPASESSAYINISPEAIRQLRRAAQEDEALGPTRQAINADQELAARLAYEMAYSRDRPISLPQTPSDSDAPSEGVYNMRVQFKQEHARQERIALYEKEKARGAPPAEIYRKLEVLNATRPTAYKISAGYFA
ncbi:MAG TPA: hypothetical protein VJ001_02505 [Rhodocyclaceae bacterium]|nr:hypothetical protein [Rhodocyclaceae bacterium]